MRRDYVDSQAHPAIAATSVTCPVQLPIEQPKRNPWRTWGLHTCGPQPLTERQCWQDTAKTWLCCSYFTINFTIPLTTVWRCVAPSVCLSVSPSLSVSISLQHFACFVRRRKQKKRHLKDCRPLFVGVMYHFGKKIRKSSARQTPFAVLTDWPRV